jgi:hypothetical protein
MVEKVPPGKVGTAEVEHFEVSEAESRTSHMLASMRPGGRFDGVDPGRYARLNINGRLLMSDTFAERITNITVVQKAHGHVLVAGLGLGMILWPIVAKPEVTKITVVEKNSDVCALVKPHLPKSSKLSVVQGDIYEWAPQKGMKFNTIYFDIWGDVSTDTLKDMEKLHRRFAPRLDRTDPKRWMNSWKKEYLVDRRHQEQASGYW